MSPEIANSMQTIPVVSLVIKCGFLNVNDSSDCGIEIVDEHPTIFGSSIDIAAA